MTNLDQSKKKKYMRAWEMEKFQSDGVSRAMNMSIVLLNRLIYMT